MQIDIGLRHIAFFMPSFAGGGAERSMVRLANAFVERGIQVDMIVVKADGPLRNELLEKCNIVDLRASRTLASLPKLARYLRKERPQALISAMDHANLVAIWAKRLAHVPCRMIVTVRNDLSASGQGKKGKIYAVTRLIGTTYRRADAVVAVSHGAADGLAKVTGFPRERINVIYNPVVSGELYTKSRKPLDHPWFAKNAPPVMLGVGRLVPQKDFVTLIRAFALVHARRPARLMILGEGLERAALEKLIDELDLRNAVALPGFMQNPYPYMKAAQIFVLSSRYEGLGNVLIEAMALGTPVVSTDCPSGPREILVNGKWGRLVPVGDVDGLAAAMDAALDHPGIGPSPRGAEFTIESALQQYENLVRGGFSQML